MEPVKLPETQELVLFILRWIHVASGILWIGLLYFFNFVNIPFGKTMDGDTKKKVVPQLMPRALFWFRWAAMFTFLSGFLYLGYDFFHVRKSEGGKPAGLMGKDKVGNGVGLLNTDRGQWITFGAGLATIMWFNVWFIIWPSQKKIIGWVRDGQKPPEMDGAVALAGKASRINTYLSVAMLFGMLSGGGHYGAPFHWAVAVATLVIAFIVVRTVYALSGTVGTEFAAPAAPPPAK